MSHILLNYALLLFWSILVDIQRELFFLVIKVIIAEMSTKILRKFVFLTMFEKWQTLKKIWICLNNWFCSNQSKGINLTKTVFLHKVSHILLNYAFLLFWNIFGEIHRELFFLNINWLSLKRALKYSEIFFLTMFERGKPEENLDLFK